MSLLRALPVCLAVAAAAQTAVRADPITLYFHEIVMGNNNLVDRTITTPDLSNGGSFDLGAYSLGVTSSDNSYPYPPPVQTIDGAFGFLVGVATGPGSQQWAGPVLDVTGNLSGTITGPGGGWVYSGSLSGTATAVSLFTGNAADLPAPLLDILNHPDHLQVSAVVTDGNQNLVDFTLTFDPPSPLPTAIPEPTALAVMLAGLVALYLGRLRCRRDHASAGQP
jgi:hypothetical protein